MNRSTYAGLQFNLPGHYAFSLAFEIHMRAALQVRREGTCYPRSQISLVSHAKVVADIRDPVIRNLQITECYADLAAAMRARTGGWADWCTFATWASRQAGTTIRGEDLLTALRR